MGYWSTLSEYFVPLSTLIMKTEGHKEQLSYAEEKSSKLTKEEKRITVG